MAAPEAARPIQRRTFLAWYMAGLMTATVLAVVAPILVFIWPPPARGQRFAPIDVSLDKPLDQTQDGDVTRFDAPTQPDSAFVMQGDDGDNDPAKLAFSGLATKNGDEDNVVGINCAHLGCSVALNKDAKTLDCPCHGSRFRLDGTVQHGPAAYPLSHLKWQPGDNPTTLKIDGIILGT